jgi:hypothetical protein
VDGYERSVETKGWLDCPSDYQLLKKQSAAVVCVVAAVTIVMSLSLSLSLSCRKLTRC